MSVVPPVPDTGQLDTPVALRPNSRLHFAPQQTRIHPDDLPVDYEAGETYRGLDSYVAAMRKKRRQSRRTQRRGSTSSRRQRHSSDDDSDDDSSSSSSSSSAGAGNLLGINMLHALFGDSDTSSSDSSTSDSDTDDGSTFVSGTSRTGTETDRVSFMSAGRRAHRTSVSWARSDVNSPAVPSGLSAWTPRLTARKQRKRKTRRSEKEAKLLRLSKPSRKARKNARRLREISGGTTEYTLYAPLGSGDNPVVKCQSWKPIGRRLADFFQYHTQQDAHQGDIGAPSTVDVLQTGTPAFDSAMAADDEIDLALPSPALSIHAEMPPDFDHESFTGRHMSDVPITPYFPRPSTAMPLIPEIPVTEETWWLDIQCPTYKVMQHLGLRFPLHPLTVEDILKQEPREKIESFERLGYYFVVLRAMDTSYFRFTRGKKGEEVIDSQTALRERSDTENYLRIEMVKNAKSKEGLEGVGVGSVNLYLVVFAHGIISFHFEDMSEHTERVQSRIINNIRPFKITPDWIVYEFYDSIVDTIAPFVSFLEHELGMIEMVINDPNLLPDAKQRRPRRPGILKRLYNLINRRKMEEPEAIPLEDMANVLSRAPRNREEVVFNSLDAVYQRVVFQRLKTIREIDSGLSRLLGPKPDVMRGISKRIVDMGSPEDQYSILLYFDDVYDHIMSMLSQLHERDDNLSHAHMVYLNRIRFSNKHAIILANYSLAWCAGVVSTVMCCTWITGTMSTNLGGLPNVSEDVNGDPIEAHNNLHSFGTVICILSTIPVMVFSFYKSVSRINSRRSDKMLKSH
ncbi:hypothetical protein MCUN1_003175 [Malassezia cuniculi]|uniref:Uncharacterized protein n=1 Tax=Malassezia cuniculi TaxID=948313 RepID=A0AAF0EXW2_9BASI|nr:hypothetical protein MCUN1_003175 [Malassezia cuniculi]